MAAHKRNVSLADSRRQISTVFPGMETCAAEAAADVVVGFGGVGVAAFDPATKAKSLLNEELSHGVWRPDVRRCACLSGRAIAR